MEEFAVFGLEHILILWFIYVFLAGGSFDRECFCFCVCLVFVVMSCVVLFVLPFDVSFMLLMACPITALIG